jgi:BirA family transcriptional regulator, biotin operon repressor / biotin---[acetyl-CoA-carboxylase] ligase
MEIILIDSVESTNTYAKDLLAENKIKQACCIVTSNQTSGKGMHKNKWESEANKNLTFSIVCFPRFFPAAMQFQLNKSISMSVIDLVKKVQIKDNVSVKWPNDIFIETKKIAGILIETSVIGENLNWVVIGIGINVNQKVFSKDLSFAGSLIQFSDAEFDLKELLNTYLYLFQERYYQLSANKHDEINKEYLENLYRISIPSEFIYHYKKITATITGVNEFGWLQLVTSDNKILECDIKEIAYVI